MSSSQDKSQLEGDFSNLANPAQRALARAGYTKLSQLAGAKETEIAELHGIGPNALKQLCFALKVNGMSFAKE